MIFESRELKSYGEFVKSEDLIEGRTYFRVSFLDQDGYVPEFIPLVFIGRNLQLDKPGLYFQDAASYISGRRYKESDKHERLGQEFYGWFETYKENGCTNVCEFEKALDQLLYCSLERKKSNLE